MARCAAHVERDSRQTRTTTIVACGLAPFFVPTPGGARQGLTDAGQRHGGKNGGTVEQKMGRNPH